MAIRRLAPWLLPIVLIVAGCSPVRLMEAARVLADIDAGSGPSALKEQTARPNRRAVSYSIDGRSRQADRYSPADGAVAAMVVVPGVTPLGRNDPRLVAFAAPLARARFEVLVPDLPRLRDLRVSPADARTIADACVHLDREGGGRPLGLTAISYAVGPAVGALFEDDMAERVDFAVTIGGYYDIDEVIAFVTTGGYRDAPGRPWRFRPPNPYGKWVFVRSNADRLGDPLDRLLLNRMAARKLADPESDIAELSEALGSEGSAVHALLTNRDPARVEALLTALPEGVRKDIRALDLERYDLGRLKTRFMIVHGRDDPVIPETESVRLAAALRRDRARLFLVDSLDHVDPKPTGFIDRMILLRAINAVLEMRDAGK